MFNLNIKNTKKCAICKYWYDPTNSAISPRNPKLNLWTIDDRSPKKKCIKKNYEMSPMAFCQDFECKLQIFLRF